MFVITPQPEYNFELGEQVAELELGLTRAGWRISVNQLPATESDSVGAFFSPEGALEVYAQRVPTPSESGS